MRRLRRVLFSLTILTVAPLAGVPVYSPRPYRPFAGSGWYNPYALANAEWLRANLHAHSSAWGGLTHGRGTVSDVAAAYRRMGYDVAPLSNYHRVDTAGATGIVLPMYEHGFNVTKSHRLVIGARGTDWFDVPALPFRHVKQSVLNRLRRQGGLVAIAHPFLRDGHTPEDLAALHGYDLVEVASHFGTSLDAWDAALSSGYPAWGIGGDDTHDVSDAGQTGVVWTMVAARARSADAVLDALEAGQSYTVMSQGHVTTLGLERLTLIGDTLHVSFVGPVQTLEFVADHGRTLGFVRGASARLVLPVGASYVRVVAHGAATTILLNPVLRSPDGVRPMVPPPAVNGPATAAMQLAALVLLGVAIRGPWTRGQARRVRRRLRLLVAGRGFGPRPVRARAGRGGGRRSGRRTPHRTAPLPTG